MKKKRSKYYVVPNSGEIPLTFRVEKDWDGGYYAECMDDEGKAMRYAEHLNILHKDEELIDVT